MTSWVVCPRWLPSVVFPEAHAGNPFVVRDAPVRVVVTGTHGLLGRMPVARRDGRGTMPRSSSNGR